MTVKINDTIMQIQSFAVEKHVYDNDSGERNGYVSDPYDKESTQK